MSHIKSKMIKLKKPLPSSLATPSAGEHLYMIGAAFYRRDPTTSRYRLHRPSLILSITGLHFLRALALLLSPPSCDERLVWIGDISVVMNLKIHFNILLLTFDYIIMFCHALHYWQYNRYHRYRRNNRCTTSVLNNAPFDLAAGLVAPLTVGFTSPQKTYRYAAFVKWSVNVCHYVTRYWMNAFVTFAFSVVFFMRAICMQSWLIWPASVWWIFGYTVK